MVNAATATEQNAVSKNRKPFIVLEMVYCFGLSILVSLAALSVRILGVEVPTLLVISVALSTLSLAVNARIFYSLTRWAVMKVDDVNLDDRSGHDR